MNAIAKIFAIGLNISCYAIKEAKADKRVAVAYHAPGSIAASIGVGLGVIETMTGARNQAILRQLTELHARRDLGQISRGLFKHQKAELIQKYVKAVGPLDRVMHETPTLQVKPQSGLVKGMNASESYLFEANRLAKLSRLAGKGGILLTVAGIGLIRSL